MDPNTLQWKIPELGVSANEGASLEFYIKHISQDSGEKKGKDMKKIEKFTACSRNNSASIVK